MKNKLPDRWTDYSKVGNIVSGTRFLPVKVPLKSFLTRFLPKEEWFSPSDLLDLAKEKGVKIGLVIDLSFTSRYYCPSDFTKHGIKHFKIFMPGRIVPDRKIITQFYEVVVQFEKENSDNNHVIVVHCTHGLNRTGYMICKFMTEKMNMPAQQAISTFNKARGHDIEREVYLNDLNSILKVKEIGDNDQRQYSFLHKSSDSASAAIYSSKAVHSNQKHSSTPFYRQKKAVSPASNYHQRSSPYYHSGYDTNSFLSSPKRNYANAPFSNSHRRNHMVASSSNFGADSYGYGSSIPRKGGHTNSTKSIPLYQQTHRTSSSHHSHYGAPFSSYSSTNNKHSARRVHQNDASPPARYHQSKTNPVGFQHKHKLPPYQSSRNQKHHFRSRRSDHDRFTPYHHDDFSNDQRSFRKHN